MKKQLLIIGIVAIFVCVSLSGCPSSPQNNSPQNKFVGIWKSQGSDYGGGTYHFFDNGSLCNNVHSIGLLFPDEGKNYWFNYSFDGNTIMIGTGERVFSFSDNDQQLIMDDIVYTRQNQTQELPTQIQITDKSQAMIVFAVIDGIISDINSKLSDGTYDNTLIATGDEGGTASVTGSQSRDSGGGGYYPTSYNWYSSTANYTIDFQDYTTTEEQDSSQMWTEMINGAVEYSKDSRTSHHSNGGSDYRLDISFSGSNFQVSIKSGQYSMVDEVDFTVGNIGDSTTLNVYLTTKSGVTYTFKYY